MRWTTDKIRQSFLDFFKERGHQVVPSASLVPKGDPTLLFTNAGMVPFKDFFLGIRKPSWPRVVDCQKCLRISGKHNDLEAVGRDSYHHTFFEMLGNWSFGDYYKKEAIAFHWELVTKIWEIPADKLWATVYRDDDEAFDVWEQIPDLLPGRVLRCGEKDNFWEMGETGPCGPCSEIHIDRGVAACNQSGHADSSEQCAVNVEGCSRFIELGNLVFIQFNRHATRNLTPLPMKHVDTGTGLERVASVLQSLETGKLLGNYDIDLFKAIIAEIQKEVLKWGGGVPYGEDKEADVSYRAIADHARAIAFLIADGIRPGKNGRDYVLRRLIRRAVRHGFNLRVQHDQFLANVCDSVVDQMGGAYQDLAKKRKMIHDAVVEEQMQFGPLLARGLHKIEEWLYFFPPGQELPDPSTRIFPAELAFELHDTDGLPIDLTIDALREHEVQVDLAGFESLMEE